MKQSIFAFLLALSLLSGTIGAQNAAPAIQKNAAATVKEDKRKQDYVVPFVNKTLPNGLEVIVLQDASVPIVTVELAVTIGTEVSCRTITSRPFGSVLLTKGTT